MRFSSLTLSQKPGSNARAKIPISDGEVSVLAILSDTAWDAYDKGLEEGEEARKGDLVLCLYTWCSLRSPGELVEQLT